MNSIIPDWEWRTFDKEITLKTDLNNLKRIIRIESSEIYISSGVVDECFRIQDDKLIIEILLQINKDGFKQWKADSKISFPLKIEEINRIYRLFKLSMPNIENETCSREEFISLAKANSRLIVTEIQKVSDIYKYEGCLIEKTDLKIDGKNLITIALKNPDTKLIKKTLLIMGLDERENLSYTNAIKLGRFDLLG